MTNVKKLANIIISTVIFLLCAYYIIRYFQWQAIFPLLSKIDLKWFLGAGAGSILLYWLVRTTRWFILLKAANINVGFCRLYIVGALSMAFAIVTPFQSGETVKVELLKKVGALDRIPGYGIFMTERIIDLIVVLLMALLSVLFGVSKLLDKENVVIIISVLLICFIVFLTVIKRIPADNPVGHFLQPFNQCIKSGKVLTSVTFLTIGGWLLVILGWYVSLRSICISLTFPETTALTITTTLISILSLIPWSLGISEVSIFSCLIYFKHDIPVAQAGALIIRLYSLMILILGFIHFLAWKLMRINK